MELVTKYEMAPFTALINMIKINYFEKTEVYKTLLAVLNDFNPDNVNSKERTEHYIQLLLKNDKDLADCLVTFLPDPVNKDENLEPEPIRLHIKTKKKKKKKHKRYYSMKRTSSLKEKVFTTASSYDADPAYTSSSNASSFCHKSNHTNINQETLPPKTVNTTILDPTTFQAVKKEIKPCPVNCTSPHSPHTYNIAPTISKTTAPICAVTPAKASSEPSTSAQGFVHVPDISVPLPLIAPDQNQNRTTPDEKAVTLPQLAPTSTPVENARTVYQTAPIESPTMLSCSDNSGNIMTKEQLSQRLSKAPEFPCFIFNQQHAYKSPLPQTIPCYNNSTTSTKEHQLIVNNDIAVKLANPKSFSQQYQDSQGFLPSSLHCPDVIPIVSQDNLYSGATLATLCTTNEGYRQQNTMNVQHVPLPEAPRDINPVPVVQWTARFDHQSSMKHCQQLPVQAIEMNTKVAPFHSLPPSMPHSVSQVVPQLLPPKPIQHALPQTVNETYHIPSAHVYLGTTSNLSSFPYTRQIIIPENPNFYFKKLPNNKLEMPLNLVAKKNKASCNNHAQCTFQTDSESQLGLTTCLNSGDAPSQVVTMATEQKINDTKDIQFENSLPFIIGQTSGNKLPLEETFPRNDNMEDPAITGDLETPCVGTKASKPRKLTMTPNQGVRKKLRLIPYKQAAKENNELPLL